MDYQDVYYVDPRNATAVVDHRGPAGRFGGAGGRFFGQQAQPATITVAPATTAPPYQYPPMFPPGFSPAFAGFGGGSWGGPTAWPTGWGGWMNPPYSYPPTGVNNLTSILGGFGDLGSLANIAAQVFAAFLPLPASPTPQDGTDGSDPATNAQVNSSNLIRYQQALATFARRDQQILTIGSVLKELFKRPSIGG